VSVYELFECPSYIALLLMILFVAMSGVLSLLMLFLLCVVYFMSDTDTLFSAFLRVMNFCVLFVTCPLVRPVHCFLCTLCMISIINKYLFFSSSPTFIFLMIYTVNHKKRDILFLTITWAHLNRFL